MKHKKYWQQKWIEYVSCTQLKSTWQPLCIYIYIFIQMTQTKRSKHLCTNKRQTTILWQNSRDAVKQTKSMASQINCSWNSLFQNCYLFSPSWIKCGHQKHWILNGQQNKLIFLKYATCLWKYTYTTALILFSPTISFLFSNI